MIKFLFGSVVAATLIAGCSTPKYAYHSVFTLNSCSNEVSRSTVVEGLIRRGYLKNSEAKGPYDIFHKPEIVKKGRLAQEPFEDRAGDIAVAVCEGKPEAFVVVEEWRGCEGRKDCTTENQRDVKRLAEGFKCQVAEKSGHSKSWKLEDRQDWIKETCSSIASNLSF